MSYNKEKDLELKYAYVDGETDPPHKSKRKKPKPKKADHKHVWQNVIIEYTYPKTYTVSKLAGKPAQALESYCTVCGKLNSPQADEQTKALFPDIYPGHFSFLLGREEKYKEYHDWCNEHYPHYNMPDYYSSMYRGGQTFLSLDKIISPDTRQ